MDYAEAGDMGKLIQKSKKLKEEDAKLYMAEVILAIEDLHRRNIIFRDLKPDNVVLTKSGHAMLTDFGLSKEGMNDNMIAKSFCGSVAYLAPEMLKK
jgi:serine/threonine protein kinase